MCRKKQADCALQSSVRRKERKTKLQRDLVKLNGKRSACWSFNPKASKAPISLQVLPPIAVKPVSFCASLAFSAVEKSKHQNKVPKKGKRKRNFPRAHSS
jgi:hypothetical protein